MLRLKNLFRIGAALAVAGMLVAGCGQTPPQEAKQIAQPKTRPTQNLTSFTEALRCMDDLYADFGIKNVVITSQGIPDATGEIRTGTKEMMISAISRMSVKSGAFTFVDFDQTQFDVNALQNLVGFTDDFVVPNYYIRGAITQLDEQVLAESESAGVSVPFADAGASRDQVVSIVSVDLNMGDLLTRQILPGTSANNSIAVRRAGESADAGGVIEKIGFGLNFNVTLNESEGMHQAVRTLVELSTLETLGKLTQVPYWRCLQVEQSNPAVRAETYEWFASKTSSEQVSFAQRALSGLNLYDGPVTGTLDAPTREAIGAYQAKNGLLASGAVDFDLYASLISRDVTLAGAPAEEQPVKPQPQAAASETESVTANAEPEPPPVALSLATSVGEGAATVGQRLVVGLSSNRDAFAYCYYQDAEGRVARIFPNRFQPDALVPSGQQVTIPSESARFDITFDHPGTIEHVVCLGSDVELGPHLPQPLQVEDLTPIPVDSLNDVMQMFSGIGKSEVVFAHAKIQVAN